MRTSYTEENRITIPHTHPTPTPAKNYLAQNVNSGEADKPYFIIWLLSQTATEPLQMEFQNILTSRSNTKMCIFTFCIHVCDVILKMSNLSHSMLSILHHNYSNLLKTWILLNLVISLGLSRLSKSQFY